MKKLILSIIPIIFLLSAWAQTDSTIVLKKKFDFEKTRSSRYLATDEVGALIGLSGHTTNKMYFSYQTVNSWQFNRYVYLGAGSGLEGTAKNGLLLNDNKKAALMVPLFGELRASFLNKRVSPYISAKMGYSFYLGIPDPELIGGGFVEGQIGVKTFINQNSSFNFSVGYRMQSLAVPEKYASEFSDITLGAGAPGTNHKTLEYFNFLSVHAGFCY